jgi:hypothetical protein
LLRDIGANYLGFDARVVRDAEVMGIGAPEMELAAGIAFVVNN